MSRDILTPPLQVMSCNRSYRVNLVHEDFGGNQKRQEGTKNNYAEQDCFGEDDDQDIDFIMEELETGSFKLTMPVAPAMYGVIIGQRGATKRRIETETSTAIIIPPRVPTGGSNKSEHISIKGKLRSNVCSAYRKILLLVQSSRERLRPTHFVSVSLASPEVIKNYTNFMREVLNYKYPSIQQNLFQEPNRLHQTLVTCCLLSETERVKAVEILQTCREFLENIQTPIKIKVNGMEIMNDDPSAVRVLYAKIECDALQQLANLVTKRFKESGLSTSKHNRDIVKLHMTLLKAAYNDESSHCSKVTFDARELLKSFSDYDFGYAECSELQLCAMHGEGDSGEGYKITGSLKF